jgi:hypothetical protein
MPVPFIMLHHVVMNERQFIEAHATGRNFFPTLNLQLSDMAL